MKEPTEAPTRVLFPPNVPFGCPPMYWDEETKSWRELFTDNAKEKGDESE